MLRKECRNPTLGKKWLWMGTKLHGNLSQNCMTDLSQSSQGVLCLGQMTFPLPSRTFSFGKAGGLPRFFPLCLLCNTRRQSTVLGWGSVAIHSGAVLMLGADQSQVRNTQQHRFKHTVGWLLVPRAPGKPWSCQLAAGGGCIPSTRFKKLTLKVLIDVSIPTG